MAVFYGEDLLASRSTPRWRTNPLSDVRDCLFNIYWQLTYIFEAFLQPQPQEAPCRGDRNPHITGMRLFY